MAREKTIFVCQQCGTTASKWMGKCAECGSWNSFVEEILSKDPVNKGSSILSEVKPVLVKEVEYDNEKRLVTGNKELDKVLGGGLVEGSIVLLGGEPGIGKSTLSLQIALNLREKKILYVSGEESAGQIKMRSQRLNSVSDNCYLLCETSLENIVGYDIVTKNGGEVKTVPLVDGFSTTSIIEKLKKL